jgi:tetraacyldisaccharide 4'-kinase
MLGAIGKLYSFVAEVRNTLYDRGAFESYSLGARTISIGNITTGGTGKTPLVAYVAEILADAGEKVCILTRGYGRQNPRDRVLVSDGTNVLVDARTGGDEPVELARKLIGKAVVVSDSDRVSAAKWAKEEFGITAFVLDDGFQHRRAKRDLDIVCIDATNPFGGGNVLPAGRLREPLRNLARAGVIVITRSDMVDEASNPMHEISRYNRSAPVFLARSIIRNQTAVTKPFAFCALGNPENFLDLLARAGYELRGSQAFPDHHNYSQAEIVELEAAALASNGEALLTTAKDMVKLEDLTFTMPVSVIEIRTEIDNEGAFRDLIISS